MSTESASSADVEANSPKKPLPYDYYNPATWLVDSSEGGEIVNQEQAAITDGIFAKLNEQMQKADLEDLQKQNEAKEEAEENARENEESPNRVVQKPGSQHGSPSRLRLPYRKAKMKIFPDEESDDEEVFDRRDNESLNNNAFAADRSHDSYGGGKLGGRENGNFEEISEQEMREQARLDAAKRAMIKHRAQFIALDDEGGGDFYKS